MGNNGTAVQTHSWGNTRRPLVGPVQPIGDVAGRSGWFPVWPNWLDGLGSTVDRLASLGWPADKPYGFRTIAELFTVGGAVKDVWAPAGDLNNPAGYLRSVLDFMNKYQDIPEETVGNPLAKFTTYQDFIPKTLSNRPNEIVRGGSPNYITVHEVGNLDPRGGTARATRNYVHNCGGCGPRNEGVSFQAVVGDTESFQLLPWNEVGYHAGDGGGDGNYDSIAIETQQVGNWNQTLANIAKLVASLMKEFDIPLSRVVQHNHWSGKNCPQYLRAGVHPTKGTPSIRWDAFLAMVEREYTALTRRAPLVQEELTLDERIIAYVDANATDAASGNPVHGGLVDLREFGGTDHERLIVFERLVAHTLNGNIFVLTLPLWDRLRNEGKVKMD